MEPKEKNRSPGVWVSTLYFAEGFPYTVVNLMSVIFLKNLGASNQLIGLTSFLYLPWVLKGLWAPVVDLISTKRQWILRTEIICIFLFLLLAIGALMPQALTISVVIFAAIAFVSATHDIAIDGFYLNALNKEQQALYVGVRSTAYKIAWLVGNGGLVFLAGYLANRYPLKFGWAAVFALAALIFLLVYLFQLRYLPHPKKSHSTTKLTDKNSFIDAFKTYFSQDKIGWIVGYILIFRLGDALTFKMAPPFLMDTVEKGGLAISTADMGILYGTVGVLFLLVGGLLGGYVIAKQGLKKWMWPTAIMQNSTNVLYWMLAVYQPSRIIWAYVVNSFEQFTYGIGVAAYTVFLMRTVRREYESSHYAITTAFMAAGVLIPGIFSGYLQAWLGYKNYFLIGSLAVIPGLITIFFLPLKERQPSADEIQSKI